MEDFLSKLPFVTEVGRNAAGILFVKYRDGRGEGWKFPISRVTEDFSSSRVRYDMDEWRELLEGRLSAGGVIFVSPGGGQIATGPDWVKENLPEVVELLSSSRSDKEKVEALENEGIHIDPKSSAGTLLKNFQGTDQLRSRVAQIRKDRTK